MQQNEKKYSNLQQALDFTLITPAFTKCSTSQRWGLQNVTMAPICRPRQSYWICLTPTNPSVSIIRILLAAESQPLHMNNNICQASQQIYGVTGPIQLSAESSEQIRWFFQTKIRKSLTIVLLVKAQFQDSVGADKQVF